MTNEEAKGFLLDLRAGCVSLYGTALYEERMAFVEALDLAISALERDRWISASTPPDTNRFVLVMNDEGRCGVAQYVGDDIAPITPWQIAYCLYDVDTWDDEEQGPVCWWRELPEPPKEET